MKQIFQVPKTGKMTIADVPAPALFPGAVMVRVRASLVSAGTERTAVEFAQKSLFDKARSRPDLVRQVIDKSRREGILSTMEAAMRKLDSPQSLGYSLSGEVIGIGEGVAGFNIGDRVACAGADYAVHAEIVAVPANLVARIREGEDGRAVSFEDAAFATLGAIAMHGLRLGEPALGESVAVIGLGVIGLIAVQLAKAAGCIVFGTDPDAARCALAERLGCDATATDADGFKTLVAARTAGRGADCVLIAAATSSNGPVELAAEVARGRARVVSVGAVGMQLPRKPYFQKELQFLVSRSYGPGRYDPNYEEKGQDYPAEFVRWTENRNMQAFLELLAAGRVEMQSLITHRFAIEEATRAYELISGGSGEAFLGVLIQYPGEVEVARTVRLKATPFAASAKPGLGVIGAGNFAASILLPAFEAAGSFAMRGVCTGRGITGKHIGDKFKFDYCTTDATKILGDDNIHAVAIATRHNSHASRVMAALSAGKHVFCEKPLCITEDELADIVALYSSLVAKGSAPVLMVGFNRRFSPMAVAMRKFFADANEPLVIQMRVNGGHIPLDSWIQDPAIGGGRIVGECCHFVDLCGYLANSRCTRVYARALPNNGRYADDNALITLEFANGSIAGIAYTANGDKSIGKERVEVSGGGGFAVLDDFRVLEMARDGKRKTMKSRLRQEKGHREECAAFTQAILGGEESPIAFESIVDTTLATFRIMESLRAGVPVAVDAACKSTVEQIPKGDESVT